MVKDEVDIVRDWVIYHGCLFGWNNIYVIDNYSTDGTYEALMEFKDLIYITREHDYKRKGEFMTNLMRTYCMGHDRIAFPIDIDEFVVYYEPGAREVTFNKDLINHYINTLPPCRVYKANYLWVFPNNPNGNGRAPAEIDYSSYFDYGGAAKSFVDTRYFNDSFDHGNHVQCNDYHLTNIVLVHYHLRNTEQIRKKCLNNVLGLGYPSDLGSLKDIIQNNPTCMGNHHVGLQIEIQENRYQLKYNENADPQHHVSIRPLKERIQGGFY